MAFQTSDQSPMAVAGQAIYPTATLPIGSSNAATTLTIPLGSLLVVGGSASQAQPAIFDAKSATVVIANIGTAQTINAASLQFVDSVSTQTATISYTLSSVSVANNANASFVAQLASGILKNVQLQVTFASAPTAGSVVVQLVLHETGAPSGGSLSTPMYTSPVDGGKATYAASVQGLAVVASATDIFEVKGSSTKTVRINRLRVSGIKTTAGAAVDIVTLVRSTANTAGTSSTPTIVPYDSNNAAATAAVKAYTANPTTGALVGNVSVDSIFVPLATASGGALDINFGNRPGQCVVLRGNTQSFCVNLNGVTVGGGAFDAWVEFTEEA